MASVRPFPGPHGPMISPNPDLGTGPYSQPNGLPFGGESAGKFIAKKRKKTRKKAREYGQAVAELSELYLKIAKGVI